MALTIEEQCIGGSVYYAYIKSLTLRILVVRTYILYFFLVIFFTVQLNVRKLSGFSYPAGVWG